MRPRARVKLISQAASGQPRVRRRIRSEAGGLVLIVFSLMVLLSPSLGAGAGLIGPVLYRALAYLVGTVGAMTVGLGTLMLGLAVLLFRSRLGPGRPVLGIFLLFVSFLGLRQIGSPFDGLIWRTPALEPGGLLGLLLAEGLKPLFGRVLGAVMLVALALASLVVMSEVPLAVILGRSLRVGGCLAWAGAHKLSRIRRKRRIRPVLAGLPRARPVPKALPAKVAQPKPVELAQPGMDPTADSEGQLDFGSQIGLPKSGDYSSYQLPQLSLLSEPAPEKAHTREETVDKMEVLERTLSSFGIDAKVVEIERGPRVTRYEIQPPPGVRARRITNLADDLALSLAALDVRVEAPVPGKGVIGIEVPNKDFSFVALREILQWDGFAHNSSLLAFALGKDIAGHPVVGDLCKMPHLLIAGATNSGKSVCLNSMIVSLLFRARPDQVKFLMVDPKRVELSLYKDIPHLVAPVAHNAKESAGLLRWAIKEMELRYELFAERGVRNIAGYNELAMIDDEVRPVYYLVIVIDELADLMMQAASEFETSICRIAQLARATGIHLVVATQRPSVNVITGTIKANIASRIAFAVASQVDSRTILDMNGAERLVGSGDMLFLPIDASKPTRIQGAYVSERDINRLVESLRAQGRPKYCAEALEIERKAMEDEGIDDEMFERALEFVLTTKHASASMLQRKFRVGYTRAARLIDIMEQRGYVGPPDGSRPREVLGGAVFEAFSGQEPETQEEGEE